MIIIYLYKGVLPLLASGVGGTHVFLAVTRRFD